MNANITELDQWIARQTRIAASAMSAAISATHLVKERPGFRQKVIPRPGSVVASLVLAAYDPDPDYFFHWFRDSAIVIDALLVALTIGLGGGADIDRFREFVEFSRSLRSLDGEDFLRRSNFRERILPLFRQYVRPDTEIAAVSGEAVLGDVRVNPDGTLDFLRWSRPQTDGPALRIIALLRWWYALPDLEASLRATMQELLADDLDFSLACAPEPCFDIWEEEMGHHYYTQLLHAEALARGAQWLAETGHSERAHACRSRADEILPRLDAFWDAASGYYRSRTDVASDKTSKQLDMAVILAVLHAGRAIGPHSVLDPRAQATLTALEELFEAEYAINRDRPAGWGPAMGRYANDTYYSGGAYFFATLAAAEFYFKLARALQSGAEMAVTVENRRFRERLTAPEAPGPILAAAAIRRGNAIMTTVQAFTPASGSLSEQFDRTTGALTSAKHLAWSYAAFITAAASRSRAYEAIPGSGLARTRAGTV
jgi:glucoamylase